MAKVPAVNAPDSPASPPAPRSVYLRWSTWIPYGLFLALGIPWYWSKQDPQLVLGLPLWVMVSLGAAALASAYTVWLLFRAWPDDTSSYEATAGHPQPGSSPRRPDR